MIDFDVQFRMVPLNRTINLANAFPFEGNTAEVVVINYANPSGFVIAPYLHYNASD